MKAIVLKQYGSSDGLQLTEVEKPTPKDNEVLIRVRATTVTAGDAEIRRLNFPIWLMLPIRIYVGFIKPRDFILGQELAGDVVSVGKAVTRFKEGDPVFGTTGIRFGAHAAYVCLPELVIKPSNMTYEEAATVPVAGIEALHFVRKAKIHGGEKVLIVGAGGSIGTSAVQIARHFGAEVTGVCSTTNLELVKSLGADTVIDYTKEAFRNRGEHYDFIFNAVGKRKAKLQCNEALTPNGKHLTVDDGSPKLHIEELTLLKELVETDKLRPVIDRCYPFEQIVEAHRYVDQGHKKGNVVIRVEHNNII